MVSNKSGQFLVRSCGGPPQSAEEAVSVVIFERRTHWKPPWRKKKRTDLSPHAKHDPLIIGGSCVSRVTRGGKTEPVQFPRLPAGARLCVLVSRNLQAL